MFITVIKQLNAVLIAVVIIRGKPFPVSLHNLSIDSIPIVTSRKCVLIHHQLALACHKQTADH